MQAGVLQGRPCKLVKEHLPWTACDEWPLERLMMQRSESSEAVQMHQAASHRRPRQSAILLASRAHALLPYLHECPSLQISEPCIVLV